MRKEASLEQWGMLYEIGSRIKELRPWDKFADMDLIGVRYGREEETIFFSILGKGGDCYGITVYEGDEALNGFMLLAMHERMNVSGDYAMSRQKNLTCYWGNRNELTDKQRKVIKDLGYKYRGKNQWLYFMSFEPGYWPCNMDENEVPRMSKYLQTLELVLQGCEESGLAVDFEHGNMLLLEFSEDQKTWSLKEEALPFLSFQFGDLVITDEDLISDLQIAPKGKGILEADVSALGISVKDRKYDRPANPAMSLLGEAKTSLMIGCEMAEPEEDPMIILAEMVVKYIFQFGAPKEIRVSNVIVEAALDQICELCGIRLKRIRRLPGLEDFARSMETFM